MMRVWRLSVAYVGPKSRTERPRKTKIGTEVAHVTHDSDATFRVKRSKVNLQCAGAYCGGLAHSLLLVRVSMLLCKSVDKPRVDSGVDRIDPLRFLAGCRKRRLNQALSVLALSIGFYECVLCCLLGLLSCYVSLHLYVFCLLVVLVVSTCQVIG